MSFKVIIQFVILCNQIKNITKEPYIKIYTLVNKYTHPTIKNTNITKIMGNKKNFPAQYNVLFNLLECPSYDVAL